MNKLCIGNTHALFVGLLAASSVVAWPQDSQAQVARSYVVIAPTQSALADAASATMAYLDKTSVDGWTTLADPSLALGSSLRELNDIAALVGVLALIEQSYGTAYATHLFVLHRVAQRYAAAAYKVHEVVAATMLDVADAGGRNEVMRAQQLARDWSKALDAHVLDVVDGQQSFNLQFLGLQASMANESRQFTAVSNICRVKAETARNAINNVR